MKIFKYTIINTEELKQLKQDKDKYFNKWLEEHHRLNELILKSLEGKKI